ncbi:MAG: AAA family ATPase, partial [Promethearchaeota archaeon]
MALKSENKANKKEANRVEERKRYIKKVILENFLSFQNDEVDFGDSKFIIILGPNWSGKTSIFQGIKFGLGSNERDERYKKWSDFIRHKQDHAMVEIHIQYGNELIQIRRTVIRGNSPFFTIKRKGDKVFKKIHATEIQNLVAELNYNPDNHFAIVSQGKIDAIKSLKPTELCSFLEEGIGLKGLREEILQQKYNVLNLNKELKSLISKKNTLNISLDLLQPKLERLEEKKKLLEVKKKYDDELLWANRKKLQEVIKDLERELLKIKVIIDEIKRKKEKIEREIKKEQKEISKIEQNINELSIKLGENNYKKQELVSKIQGWQKKKIIVKQELDILTEKITKSEKILNNYENQKKILDNELRIIKKEKNEIELYIDDLIKEQNLLTKKIERNNNFFEKYNLLISEKKEKRKIVQENKKAIKEINNQINQIFQSFKDIEHKLEKNKWFLENPTKNLLFQLDKDLRKNTMEQYSIESDIEELERERFKKFRKLKQLQTSLRERRVILPTNITILKDEIKKRDLNVKGPIIEYLKYDDTLSYAIESVLGEKLLYSFVADNWDTFDLLKRLKAKYKAYCNIYIPKDIKISPLPEISAPGTIGYLAELITVDNNNTDIKKVIYSKIKNCLVVKDFRSGKDLHKRYSFKGKCVTLKGEQIISYKYVYETPFLKQLKGLLSTGTQKEQSKLLESEVKSLNERILELKVEVSKLDNLKREIFKKKESFNDLLYNFNQKQRLTAKKNRLYQQRSVLEENNTIILKEIKDLTVEIKNLESQKDPEFLKWNNRIKKIPEELNIYNNEKKKWDQKLNENLNILKEVENKINSHNNALSLVKQNYNAKKENFQKADKDAFNIYRDLGLIEDEINEINEKMLELKEERNKLLEDKSVMNKKNIQINLNLEQENIKLNSSKQELEAKKNDLERINSQIEPLISENKIEIRPIDVIKTDIFEIDKKLLNYLDVDDSILVERDQIIVGLKEIDKNQKDLQKDIKAAMKTENKMEDTYYN